MRVTSIESDLRVVFDHEVIQLNTDESYLSYSNRRIKKCCAGTSPSGKINCSIPKNHFSINFFLKVKFFKP